MYEDIKIYVPIFRNMIIVHKKLCIHRNQDIKNYVRYIKNYAQDIKIYVRDMQKILWQVILGMEK